MNQGLEVRFSKFVGAITTNGCMPWIGHKTKYGYGSFWFKGKPNHAHRVAYIIYFGEIPKGMLVRHKCDNPTCVNPQHLEVGTPLDNMRDCIERGRRAKGPRLGNWAYGERNGTHLYPERVARGENAPQAKLTKEQAIEVRRLRGLGIKLKEISARFSISEAAVSLICSNKVHKY